MKSDTIKRIEEALSLVRQTSRELAQAQAEASKATTNENKATEKFNEALAKWRGLCNELSGSHVFL